MPHSVPNALPGGSPPPAAASDPSLADAGFVAQSRHHAWATDRLLAACEGLPEEPRTQVRHALTILGYEPPDIDAWAWDEDLKPVEG